MIGYDLDCGIFYGIVRTIVIILLCLAATLGILAILLGVSRRRSLCFAEMSGCWTNFGRKWRILRLDVVRTVS